MRRLLIPLSFPKSRKFILTAPIVTAGVILASVIFLAARWPFRREAVLKDLQDASLSNVDTGAFQGTYFPRPGCVLEHVTFQHNRRPGALPLINNERVRIEGSFFSASTSWLDLNDRDPKKTEQDEGGRISIPGRKF